MDMNKKNRGEFAKKKTQQLGTLLKTTGNAKAGSGPYTGQVNSKNQEKSNLR